MHILLSDKTEFRNHYANFAKQPLEYFVAHSHRFYGEIFAVYNVHGLIHLSEDMRFGSPWNGISSFPFENDLQKFVRNSQNPVVQVAKNINDISFAGGTRLKNKLYISPRQKDNCFLMDNKYIVFIKKKISESQFLCNQIEISSGGWDELFKKPISSEVLNIMVINRVTRNENIELSRNELFQKCICVPFKTRFIVFPMLHTMN